MAASAILAAVNPSLARSLCLNAYTLCFEAQGDAPMTLLLEPVEVSSSLHDLFMLTGRFSRSWPRNISLGPSRLSACGPSELQFEPVVRAVLVELPGSIDESPQRILVRMPLESRNLVLRTPNLRNHCRSIGCDAESLFVPIKRTTKERRCQQWHGQAPLSSCLIATFQSSQASAAEMPICLSLAHRSYQRVL